MLSIMKTQKNKNVTNCIGLLHTKYEAELLRPIR